jgi:mono/diheme cytochrome c family protein
MTGTILRTVLIVSPLLLMAIATANAAADKHVARGRYLIEIGGCNDCHTAGYAMNSGKVPQKQWLMGDQLGWQGPWGTTYAPNLRLTFSKMSEEQWLKFARQQELKPPMPFWSLRAMPDGDLRAIYRFVKTLQPIGDAAPAYLPPGQEARGPVVKFPAPPK